MITSGQDRAAHFLTCREERTRRPISHLGIGTHPKRASDRPFLHLNPPASSLLPPIISRDSAHFLTYPAHILTFGRATLGNKAKIRALNLNLECLNKENRTNQAARLPGDKCITQK